MAISSSASANNWVTGTERRRSFPVRLVIRTAETLYIAVCIGMLASTFAELDAAHPLAMLATYPPRILAAATCGIWFMILARKRYRWRALLSLVMAVGMLWQSGWAVPGADRSQQKYGVFAMNVNGAAHSLGVLANHVEQHHADVIVIQDLNPEDRGALSEALPEFEFFWPDAAMEFERASELAFTNITGVRRSRITAGASQVDTAITGFRTFATRVPFEGQDLWIVNVHSAKAILTHKGVQGAIDHAPKQAQRHLSESNRLRQWMAEHAGEAVLIAGDFNAPIDTVSLRIPNTTHAHRFAGFGPHLTFPRAIPLLSVDHILGNDQVVFGSYMTPDLHFGDHRAQVARFSM